MSFTGKIRLFLVFVAILPPVLIMIVIYFSLIRQAESIGQFQASTKLHKYEAYLASLENEFKAGIQSIKEDPVFLSELSKVNKGTNRQLEIDPKRFNLDFIEIMDTNYIVRASFHRPGLIGEKLNFEPYYDQYFSEKIEYDIEGRHASFNRVEPVGGTNYIFVGYYLDNNFTRRLNQLMGAEVNLVLDIADYPVYNQMERKTFYESDGNYEIILAGSQISEFYLTAKFPYNEKLEVSNSILHLAMIVALVSILMAVLIGIYVTGKAKKEIQNLVTATTRVAEGDFSTPVMAYEEGEFSQLADSFSEMMFKLKVLRKELATTEKIAAWQSVSRKIAHEIKNPLSPISISIDDLKRSYDEKLPEFEKTLEETTTTIKKEIFRLTQIIDEFVSFARLKAPAISNHEIGELTENIKKIFKHKIEENRFVIDSRLPGDEICYFDLDLMTQVLINLIKNGFEAAEGALVKLSVFIKDDNLIFKISDSGPGFTKEKLENSFEPYVSTKPDGSGLGLVICHRIVHDHNGRMELYNKTDYNGAVVEIILPR